MYSSDHLLLYQPKEAIVSALGDLPGGKFIRKGRNETKIAPFCQFYILVGPVYPIPEQKIGRAIAQFLEQKESSHSSYSEPHSYHRPILSVSLVLSK